MVLREYFDKEWLQIHFDYGSYYLLLILLILSTLFLLRRLSRPKRRLPPGPIGLPFVGYLPFLGKEPFRELDKLSKKYGNVYSLFLGQTYVVILGDYTAVKDAFSKSTTTDRPPRLFDFLPDAVGISSVNGAEWIEQRRFTMRSMKDIGLGKNTWTNLVEDEVSDFLKVLMEKKGEPIDIKTLLTSSIANNIGSFLFGKRLPPGPDRDRLHSSIDTVMSVFSQSGLWAYYPWLCDILVKLKITYYYRSFCDMVAFNKLIRKEVDMHRQSEPGVKDDFISTYIEAMQTRKAEGNETFFNERNLMGNTQALYIAGTDTTRTSLVWLFLAMAAYPDIQEKVHRELDSVLGKNGNATWEDRQKFPYIYAIIMECQRWKTIAPLNTSRIAMEDIQICGYDIPKGSTIIANNWGIHNDTRYWTEPEKFKPERFLKNDGKEVILTPESYVPFSFGKRKCPGEIVGLMEIFLYFTAIMQTFDVKAPKGGQPNLNAECGLTYQPVPQELCFLLRHEVHERM